MAAGTGTRFGSGFGARLLLVVPAALFETHFSLPAFPGEIFLARNTFRSGSNFSRVSFTAQAMTSASVAALRSFC